MNKKIEWANESMKTGEYADLHRYFAQRNGHWSRVVEYPWAMRAGNFLTGSWVLDAAGGGTCFGPTLAELHVNVVNIDLDLPPENERDPKIRYVHGDLKKLPFPDGCFDRVVCLSVIEHIVDPVAAITEVWRVLKPGGRLIVTMDIASYYRWNHTVDLEGAKKIVGLFGLEVPPEPPGIMTRNFPEIERKPGDPLEVSLKVLCFWVDKH